MQAHDETAVRGALRVKCLAPPAYLLARLNLLESRAGADFRSDHLTGYDQLHASVLLPSRRRVVLRNGFRFSESRGTQALAGHSLTA